MNILVFDIETIPDTNAGNKLYNLKNLSEPEIMQAMQTIRRNKTNGNDFLPHYLQKIVAISVVFKHGDNLQCWSIGEEDSTEAELIERFWQGLAKYQANLISWNGSGFDLPVLHYRSMLHKISAPKYWEMGERDPSYKWNNYISRYHFRHIDVMDLVSLYQARAYAPLDDIAKIMGFPGKISVKGDDVSGLYLANKILDIRNYCETDVLNTYLVYLNFELFRGKLHQEKYDIEINQVKSLLENSDKEHFHEFLKVWEQH